MANKDKKVKKSQETEDKVKEEVKEELSSKADDTAEDAVTNAEEGKNADNEAAKEQKSPDSGKDTGNSPKEENAGKTKTASGKGKRLKHGALSVTFTVIFVAAVVLLNVIFN
ncbi:MAG: hypothetical protein K2N36_08565, partial [Ruminiclostridium sp.]|nr:hypothetical protein [Ruminiclostridium sp.]